MDRLGRETETNEKLIKKVVHAHTASFKLR